jgi:hypothetical protein
MTMLKGLLLGFFAGSNAPAGRVFQAFHMVKAFMLRLRQRFSCNATTLSRCCEDQEEKTWLNRK